MAASLPQPTSLLLDAMLGRLARWLRLMGYDAAYLSDTDDVEVIRQARAESRLILTRDRGLASRRGVRAVLIESQELPEQISQVVSLIGPPPQPVTPRCVVCNVPLLPISAEAARDHVPPYVWRSSRDFTRCQSCNRIYWQGTHWDAIRAQLENLRS